MKFTALTKADVDLILSLQKDNFSDGWNKEQLNSAFDSQTFHAVALFNGQTPLGLITYSQVFDTADIEGVVVVSSERKKGYGKMLVNYALTKLKESGAVSVLLEVRESNVCALRLYLACEFKSISIRKKYYSDGENAVVMKKEL